MTDIEQQEETMSNEQQTPQAKGPEAGATEEAIVLHGDKARAEQYEQPEAVALDGDTLVAKRDGADD